MGKLVGTNAPAESFRPQVLRRYYPPVFQGFANGVADVDAMEAGGRLLVNHFVLGGSPRMRIKDGALCLRLGKTNIEVDADQSVSTSAGAAVGSDAMMVMQQPLAAGGPIPVFRRLFYLTASILMEGPATWGQVTGIRFRSRRSGINFWVTDVSATVDRAGFGVVGDQAGNWRWVSKADDTAASVFDESVTLDWPVAKDEFCNVSIVLMSATASRLATVEVWLGGVLQLSRSWAADGTSLTLPTTVLATGEHSWFHAINGEGAQVAGVELWLRDYEWAIDPVHPFTGEFFNGL